MVAMLNQQIAGMAPGAERDALRAKAAEYNSRVNVLRPAMLPQARSHAALSPCVRCRAAGTCTWLRTAVAL